MSNTSFPQEQLVTVNMSMDACRYAGGAADVVMMAMLKVSRNKRLQELGYKMLLQIHDEVRNFVASIYVIFKNRYVYNVYACD